MDYYFIGHYIKKVYGIVVFVLLCLLLVIQLFQWNTTEKMSESFMLIDSKLLKTKAEVKDQLLKYTDSMNNHLSDINEKISSLKRNDMVINSRIDVLDNAVELEEKRRVLVTKIRDAIRDNSNERLNIRDINRIAVAVIDYSYQYDLAISRVLAQIRQESDFNIKAVSKAGAQGLMQIMPATLEYIELKNGKIFNPWNIYHNIRAGCFYMSEQITEFGNYEDALRAYNWGPNSLKRYLAGEISDMPDETKKYVLQVKKWEEIFKSYGLE